MKPIDKALNVLKMNVQTGNSSAEIAQQYDLPTYLEEALKQSAEKRKKKEGAQKLRQKLLDHEEDGQIYDYYRQNHPNWFNTWRDGGGE